jgi:guanylate kinase
MSFHSTTAQANDKINKNFQMNINLQYIFPPLLKNCEILRRFQDDDLNTQNNLKKTFENWNVEYTHRQYQSVKIWNFNLEKKKKKLFLKLLIDVPSK